MIDQTSRKGRTFLSKLITQKTNNQFLTGKRIWNGNLKAKKLEKKLN